MTPPTERESAPPSSSVDVRIIVRVVLIKKPKILTTVNYTRKILLDCIKQPYNSGLSILGGDPLCQDDMGLITLNFLARKVHSLGKTVWLWTGFKWEDFNFTNNFSLQSLLLSACDVVVDGPFIEAEKDLSLAFRGSRNQRIIDVRKTLGKGEIILYKE